MKPIVQTDARISRVDKIIQIAVVRTGASRLRNCKLRTIVYNVSLNGGVIIGASVRCIACTYYDPPQIINERVAVDDEIRSGMPALDTIARADDSIICDYRA